MITYTHQFTIPQTGAPDVPGELRWEIDLAADPRIFTLSGQLGPQTWRKGYADKEASLTALSNFFADLNVFAQEVRSAQVQNQRVLKTKQFPLSLYDEAGAVPASLQFYWDGEGNPPAAAIIIPIRSTTFKLQWSTPEDVLNALARIQTLRISVVGSLQNLAVPESPVQPVL